MNPAILLTFPTRFDPNTMCFDKTVYQKADTAFRTCTSRVDSTKEAERKCSIVATNMIVYLINELIRRPLSEILGHSNPGEHPDASTVQKVEQIIQPFLSKCPESFETGAKKEARIENWGRVQNILRSFYRSEIQYLKKFVPKIKAPRPSDLARRSTAIEQLYINCPGSLADAVGCEVERRLQEANKGKQRRVASTTCRKEYNLRFPQQHRGEIAQKT